jgi:hypothetical protein
MVALIGCIENNTRGLPVSPDGFPILREVCPGCSEDVVQAITPSFLFTDLENSTPLWEKLPQEVT